MVSHRLAGIQRCRDVLGGLCRERRHEYHIRQVCCADEYAKIQDDNAYTNAAVARCFRLAHQVAAIVGEQAEPSGSK